MSNESDFLRRMRQVDDRLNSVTNRSHGLPDNVILIADRSDKAIHGLSQAIRIADEKKVGWLYSSAIRSWLNSPTRGHFIVHVFNRADRSSVELFDDDFDELLAGIVPMISHFLEHSNGNQNVAWLDLLSPNIELHFSRWFQAKRQQSQNPSDFSNPLPSKWPNN